MAYDFIPTNPSEISLKIKDKNVANQVTNLLIDLQNQFPSIKDPLAIDVEKSPKNIKITRKLSTSVDLKVLKKKHSELTLSFGDGSRGGRGTGNKGNLFEYELASDIEAWWRGEDPKSEQNKKLIHGLVEEYGLDKWKDLFVDGEGAENKPRPLMISGDSILISPGLVDIGAVVTDITLRPKSGKDNSDAVFLSLKYSSTVTFFNAGTKKYLTDAELESGLIKNKGGQALLDLFGINNAMFCSVFNGRGKNFKPMVTTSTVNKTALQNLIKSGIGYGFHMVHLVNKSTMVSKKITKQYRDAASKVESVTVYYGGKGGNGARVDIEVITPKYILKFNFRNKQGGKYISHLMCDYSYR